MVFIKHCTCSLFVSDRLVSLMGDLRNDRHRNVGIGELWYPGIEVTMLEVVVGSVNHE